ncbi:MAG: HVO_0476 family zinc finger protein [Haloferacaceae archaeon]
MEDVAERVAVDCPGCGAETVHEVLKPGGRATVRCTDCGHTHKTRIEPDPTVEREVVVSQEGESITTTTEREPDEELAVGDEFLVDTPAAIQQVRVTSLEVGDEQRAESAAAEAVDTVWTRVVDNVAVPVTVHPKEGDGRHEQTRSLTVRVPGDHEFTVGETVAFGDEEFEIEGVQVRDDAPEYRFEKLDHDGDAAFARDVKRVYGRDTTTSAWSGW